MIYPVLNIFFFVFHSAFTLFNLTGWAFRRTRKWHLFTIGLTALSWFGLGIWYGWGYCVCTDWHWQVREAMGMQDRSNSYIHFLLFKLTGFNLSPALVESVTLFVFLICAVLSMLLYRCDRKRFRRLRV
jgi:hypothetical protein